MRSDFRPCAVSPAIWQCETAEREVPDRHLVAKIYFHQRPHLYSQQELEDLLAATGRLWPTYPLKRLMLPDAFWAFGMYRVASFRSIETQCCACGLGSWRPADRENQVQEIEAGAVASHGNPCLAPLCPSAIWPRPVCDDSPLFVSSDGNRLTYRAVQPGV